MAVLEETIDIAVIGAGHALERAAEKMEENGFKFFYHHHHFEFSKFSDGETVFGYMLKQAKHINFTADTYWLQYGGAALPSFFDRLLI